MPVKKRIPKKKINKKAKTLLCNNDCKFCLLHLEYLGLFLIVFGFWLLIKDLGLFDFIGPFFWPFAFMLVGLYIFASSSSKD